MSITADELAAAMPEVMASSVFSAMANAPAAERRVLEGPQRLESAFPLEAVMALDPMAFEQAFFPFFLGGDEESKPYKLQGDVAIVSIQGPLTQRGNWMWDGYEKIRRRFEAALGDPKVRAVAMQIDSPGGSCAGCFDTARAMRAMAKASGKPVLAFADETAASAAYAMAMAADELYLPESGTVGSVGVLAVLSDQTKMNERMGLRVHVLTTGKHKADGHPHVPLTDDVIQRYQKRVEALGAQFHELVAESRGTTPSFVKGLEASVFHGQAAVEKKLADGVTSLDGFLRIAAERAKASRPAGRQTEKRMNTEKTTASSGPVGGEAVSSPQQAIDFKAIALSLGLPFDSNEAKILDSIASVRRDATEVMRLTGRTTMTEALGAVQAGQIAIGQLEAVSRELASLREGESAREVDGIVAVAKREGKIMSDAVETEMRAIGKESPQRLKSLLAALPALVTTASSASREPRGTGSPLSSEAMQVARQMGLKPEDVLKAQSVSDEDAQEGV